MRYLTTLKKKRFSERVYIDHFIQLWFNYHFLFFRSLILRGLKLRAFTIFSGIKNRLKWNQLFDPSFVFLICMLRITPALMLKTIKVGGSSYLVPFPITYWKKITFACQWVIKLLKENYGSLNIISASKVLIFALYGFGLAFDKKKKLYFTAFLNKHLLRNKAFKK